MPSKARTFMETTSRADFQQWDLERKKPAAKRELMDLKVKMDPTTTYSGNFVDHKVSGGARRCGSAWQRVAAGGSGWPGACRWGLSGRRGTDRGPFAAVLRRGTTGSTPARTSTPCTGARPG